MVELGKRWRLGTHWDPVGEGIRPESKEVTFFSPPLLKGEAGSSPCRSSCYDGQRNLPT